MSNIETERYSSFTPAKGLAALGIFLGGEAFFKGKADAATLQHGHKGNTR